MPSTRTARRGVALVAAILAILVIGLMVGGVFFATRQEGAMAISGSAKESALRVAEMGLNAARANWKSGAVSSLAVGGTQKQIYDSTAKSWTDTVTITKLTSTVYALASCATVTRLGQTATQRTQLLVRTSAPAFSINGAMTINGQTKIGGSSYINGTDTPPTGWGCGSTQPTLAAVAIADSSKITFSGCSGYTCLSGSPKILTDSNAADTATYTNYGNDFNYAMLASEANVSYSGSQSLSAIGPVVTSGKCVTSNLLNWGDVNRNNPAGACESYYPIVYFSGGGASVHITGGSGQGILLVDGNLIIDGGFQFFGIVIVKGSFSTQGTGGHINGALMAENVDLEQNTVLGNAVVNYSSCSIQNATAGIAIARPITQRGWADLF